MSDKKKMPVSGGGPGKGKPDGVSASPDTGEAGGVQGRSGGGESAGGSYPNPHSGSTTSTGFPEHGGQSENAYYGGNNSNATTGGSSPNPQADPKDHAAVREPHTVTAGEQSFDVVEDSGVAAAEVSGKVANSAPNERDQDKPGAG